MNKIIIEDYRPEWQPHFEALNKAWIEKYFVLEEIDRFVLSDPEEAILKDGGRILFAVYNGRVIGTVALKKADDHTLEMTKMAVDEAFQGMGAGKLLCRSAISKARETGVKELVLYTHSALKSALGIYEKLGFTEVPVEPGKYQRADIKMSINLYHMSSYHIKTGFENMDLAAIHRYLSMESYWAKGVPKETVEQSLRHSFCVGVFNGTEQVGFARLVTDYTTFAYLADVYILEPHRGKGLSKMLMQYLMDLDWTQKLRRMMLVTLDAHSLYSGFGFYSPEFPERVMEWRGIKTYNDPTKI